jgi:hypothetical protein
VGPDSRTHAVTVPPGLAAGAVFFVDVDSIVEADRAQPPPPPPAMIVNPAGAAGGPIPAFAAPVHARAQPPPQQAEVRVAVSCATERRPIC